MVYDNIHSLTGQMLRLRDNFLIDKEATANPGLKTTSVLKGNEKRPFVLKARGFRDLNPTRKVGFFFSAYVDGLTNYVIRHSFLIRKF